MKREMSKRSIAVRELASPLRELTCHLESHSVICHPAEVTFPPLPQPIKTGTRLSGPRVTQDWVDLVFWLHAKMVYQPEDGHPSLQY